MAFAHESAEVVCDLHDARIGVRTAPEQILTAPAPPETQRCLARLPD